MRWPHDITSLPFNRERTSWQSSSPPPPFTLPPFPPQHQEQAESRFSPLLSSFPPSPKNEHSKPRQLAKSSLPASPLHVDSHLSCPAVMEPGLRASPRRIHAPKSIKLCVSRMGELHFFWAQLNGTARLRVCLGGIGRQEVWRHL